MIHRKFQLSVPKTRNPYIRHSIYCKPYYILGSVEVTQLYPCMWGFQALPGHSAGSRASRACRGLQGLHGPPRASRKVQVRHKKMRPAAYSQSPEPWARLKFHAGWSGYTRPPTMAGGGGLPFRPSWIPLFSCCPAI